MLTVHVVLLIYFVLLLSDRKMFINKYYWYSGKLCKRKVAILSFIIINFRKQCTIAQICQFFPPAAKRSPHFHSRFTHSTRKVVIFAEGWVESRVSYFISVWTFWVLIFSWIKFCRRGMFFRCSACFQSTQFDFISTSVKFILTERWIMNESINQLVTRQKLKRKR